MFIIISEYLIFNKNWDHWLGARGNMSKNYDR